MLWAEGFLPSLALASGAKLNLTEQEALVKGMLQKLQANPHTPPHIRSLLLYDVIRKCPDTPKVGAAYLNLALLLINEFQSPRYSEAARLLQRFVNRYPQSLYLDEVRSTLKAIDTQLSK